jgi:class 3 adenylate cyclase/predicted ATPase
MVDTQTVTNPQDYLPEHLWMRWQAGDAMPGFQHLQAVLRAVLTYLPHCVGRPRLADPKAPGVSGAFAQATLLFADIAGFTAMSERLTQLGREGAEVVTGVVNDYFATMLGIIAHYGGDLFKFGGDALLVCFSGDDAAVRGCCTALEMQRAMDRFAVIETTQGTFNLRMTAGLGTGRLFLASLGSPDRLEFAVMGLALEQMARAEDLAEAGEVVVDQATCRLAGLGAAASERTPGYYHLAAMTGLSSHQVVEPATLSSEYPNDARWLAERLDALAPYLPPGILERIIVSPGRRMIEGEHRLVTVLFANFYGINAIIEALGPGRADEITTILNRHFTAMGGVIRKYGGIVNKVDSYAVGYRIMALFGAPIAHEDDPARAVRAALEMQEAMKEFASLPTSAGHFALKQRIGVNAGYVFAGNMGSRLRQEYSVMGDEVNLAARLMSAATEGQVLISQSTARQVEGLFEWQERKPVKVKGKRQPVSNYQVSRSVTARGGHPAARGAFFGRQKELAAAQALVDAALTGHGAVLDLSGERGIGKSRLVAELSVYAGERGMTTLHSAAVSYGRSLLYLPWIGVLHALLELQEDGDESPERRRDKLIAGLDEAGLSDWAPIVGQVLGVEIAETSLTTSLDAQLRQQRFFDVVLSLIQRQTDRSPLLLVLDDMQWADAVSVDLTAYVARNVLALPLLFVIVHHPDLDSFPWCAGGGCHELYLDEMDDRTSLALARLALEGIEPSPSICRLILDRAQGNPLFVEEVARALSESGIIQLEVEEDGKGVWTIADDVSDMNVPTTLTGLIMSRIDRLETTNRRLLQVAAVIGVAFRSPVLAHVYPYGDLDGMLESRLTKLTQLDLMSFSPPNEYAFKHTLTQEVAYESLPFARRRELHVRVGEDIERSHAGDLAEHYGVLARHFDKGYVFDKAFVYLVQAGDQARDAFANEAAIDHYRRALEIAGEQLSSSSDVQSRVLGALEAMGDVYLLVGRYTRAIEQFQQAIAHAMCTARHSADLWRKVASAHEQQGQYDKALKYLARGRLVLSEDEQDERSAEMARICDLSGWVRMRRGEMEIAIEECEQGLAIVSGLARDETFLRDEANLYKTLGAIYVGLGDYAQAASVYRRSTDLYWIAGDLPGLARSYNNLAVTCWGRGDLAETRDYLQHSLEISQKIGDNHMLALLHNNLGAVSYRVDDVEQALEEYHAALSLRRRIGDSHGVGQTCNNIGEALVNLERYDEARRYLEQAAAAFEAIQSEAELPEVYWLLAKVELAQKDVVSALEYAELARRTAATTGNPEFQGIAERVLAQCQAQMGNVVQARQSFEASIALLAKLENQTELARSHYALGLLLVKQAGQEELARDHLQRAVGLFAAAGAEKEAAQARAALVERET